MVFGVLYLSNGGSVRSSIWLSDGVFRTFQRLIEEGKILYPRVLKLIRSLVGRHHSSLCRDGYRGNCFKFPLRFLQYSCLERCMRRALPLKYSFLKFMAVLGNEFWYDRDYLYRITHSQNLGIYTDYNFSNDETSFGKHPDQTCH